MTNSLSTQTSLRSVPFQDKGELHVYHRTAGTIPAGSGVTTVTESWGCILQSRAGTTHGQWFKTPDEAHAKFDRLISPDRHG